MPPKEGFDHQEIIEQDRAHVWHPMMQHQLLKERDLLLIHEGKGVHIVDGNGKSYIDAIAGIWNVTLGYGRDEIAQAAFDQMKELPFASQAMVNVPAARLSAQLARILPGDLQHTFFINSGSEAAETALKIARQYGRQKYPGEGRYKVISRYQGYHGFTMGALSATGQVGRRTRFEPLVPGFLHVDPPYCYRCPLKLEYPSCGVACADEIEEVIVREGAGTVAAVIAEPIIGGGGVLVPPDEYLPRLRQICDRYGILLILDEVITGFGRTGKPFAAEHWDVVPDIMVTAKGVTSGYLPLGACTVTSEVFDVFMGAPGEEREFAQISTCGGHPVCCAAASAAVGILVRERLWENAAAVGAYLLDKLQELDSPYLGDVRGKGLMIGVELIGPDGEMLDAPRAALVQERMKEEGMLVGRMSRAMTGPESVFLVAPPLVLTEAEADSIVEIFRLGLASID